MLSKVYHWFTEGFDTKDLQDAKVLLEELASEKSEAQRKDLGDVAEKFGFVIGAKLLAISRLLTCSLSKHSELKRYVAPDRVEVTVRREKNGAGVAGGQS